MRVCFIMLTIVLGTAAWAAAQSNSLFLRAQAVREQQQAAATQPASNGALPMPNTAMTGGIPASEQNAAIRAVSLTAIQRPEPRLIQVNDLITVIVRHRLRYQSESKTQQRSEWDLQAKLDAWFRLHDRKLVEQDFQRGTPEVDFQTQNDLQNQGRANRKDIFETRVMAKVVDVKPNGNLMLVGHSRVRIGEEVQPILLTGECNSKDIAPDGSILSDKIYGLDVDVDNDGAMQDVANRGWLKRFLDQTKAF